MVQTRSKGKSAAKKSSSVRTRAVSRKPNASIPSKRNCPPQFRRLVDPQFAGPSTPTYKQSNTSDMAPEKIDMLLYDMKPNFDHIRKTMGLHKANFTLKVLMLTTIPDSGIRFCCHEKHGFVIYDKKLLVPMLEIYARLSSKISACLNSFMRSSQSNFTVKCQCPNMVDQNSLCLSKRMLFYKFRQPFNGNYNVRFYGAFAGDFFEQDLVRSAVEERNSIKPASWMFKEAYKDIAKKQGFVFEMKSEDETSSTSSDEIIPKRKISANFPIGTSQIMLKLYKV
ncbi:hypothetical protein E3P96_03628 [Wallemia ichthyophaga]|nr:hypothetical protein E3P96_03628 [Wallemia ichthyophaga]